MAYALGKHFYSRFVKDKYLVHSFEILRNYSKWINFRASARVRAFAALNPSLTYYRFLNQPILFCQRHLYYSKDASSTEIKEDTEAETVSLTFVSYKGEEFPIKGKVGDNLLVLAQENKLDIDGACERSLRCTTCHVYIQDEYFDKIEEATEEELDMLDTAKFLEESSRLACQLIVTKAMEGMRVRLPLGTINFYIDGTKPAAH